MTANNQATRPKSSDAGRADPALSLAADCVLIVLMTLGLYGLLMQRYPIIYGGDPVARLVNFPRILNGHQLPLLQVLIYCTMRWFYGPKGIFLLMAFISAAACAGVYALTREVAQDRRAAWLAAILYATHPFILYYSRVPYQEPLLLAGTAWGFYYLFLPRSAKNQLFSSLLFGVACLSRYEGWIAALAAALFQIRQNRRREGRTRLLSVVQPLATFGWAPAAWILWNRGLSPAGSYVLDLGLDWGRFYRAYFVAKSAFWWTESAVVLIALIGFACSWLDERMRNDERFHTLLGFLVLLLTALLFSGHGIEPDATRIVTEREAFVPISILVLYGGIGGSRLIAGFAGYRIRSPLLRLGISFLIVFLAAGYSLNRGFHRVAAANVDPDLATDYQVARFLAERQASGLVLAAPLPIAPVKSYLQSVGRWSGTKGSEKARQLLGEVETTPLDYQRVLMFSWLGKDKVFSSDRLRGFDCPSIERFLRENRINYLVVFSDFTPVAEHERILMAFCAENRVPEIEIGNGGRIARIYPIRTGAPQPS